MSVGTEGKVDVEAIIGEESEPEVELEEFDAWAEAEAEADPEAEPEASSKDWVTGRLAVSVIWGLGFLELWDVDIARVIRRSISRGR